MISQSQHFSQTDTLDGQNVGSERLDGQISQYFLKNVGSEQITMPQSQHLARLRTVEDRKVGSKQIMMP